MKYVTKKEALDLYLDHLSETGSVGTSNFERGMKRFLSSQGLAIKAFGKNYQDNQDDTGADYTLQVIHAHPELLRKYRNCVYDDTPCGDDGDGGSWSGNRRPGTGSAPRGHQRQTARGGGRAAGSSRGRGRSTTDYSEMGYFEGMRAFHRNNRRRGTGGFSFSGLMASPFGKILVILAVLFGIGYFLPGIYDFIVNGPLFKIILGVILVLGTIGVLRSERINWPLPIKILVLAVFWLTLIYIVLGDSLYYAVMSVGGGAALLLKLGVIVGGIALIRSKNVNMPMLLRIILVVGALWCLNQV